MKITINDHRKIIAIQEEFNSAFPFLKLEFLAKPSSHNGAPAIKLMHSGKSIGECRTIHTSGEITITPALTVVDLEQRFSDVYGLSVLVLRKSGKVWLETTVTDGWTLEEQNAQGEALNFN